jgi:hypothetical protein
MDQEQEEVIWIKPSIHDTFSFQLGFSMTVHKETIDKVVLDLHYKSNPRKQLGFDGIFVALSRVRCCSMPQLPAVMTAATSEAKTGEVHEMLEMVGKANLLVLVLPIGKELQQLGS